MPLRTGAAPAASYEQLRVDLEALQWTWSCARPLTRRVAAEMQLHLWWAVGSHRRVLGLPDDVRPLPALAGLAAHVGCLDAVAGLLRLGPYAAALANSFWVDTDGIGSWVPPRSAQPAPADDPALPMVGLANLTTAHRALEGRLEDPDRLLVRAWTAGYVAVVCAANPHVEPVMDLAPLARQGGRPADPVGWVRDAAQQLMTGAGDAASLLAATAAMLATTDVGEVDDDSRSHRHAA